MTGPDRLTAALAERYTLERELGAGGMATVYLAHDLRHDRKVAIKVLRPELAAVLGAERFVQEIRTTANLQHPHILPLFDSGEADSFLYYVMPYIEGETLRDRLNREKQLSVDEAVRITTEVADALDYAHRQSVIHRDIKPENILLHDGRPMVADFGIALAVSAAAGGRMTETGLSLGTPHYMSPEQATAEKDLTPRSDIYSLGAVLYEMLTGSPPHTGSTAQQVIAKIVAQDPAPVTQARRAVPPNVAAAVMTALGKLPADRFVTPAAFAQALGNPGFRGAAPGGTMAAAPGPWKRMAVGATVTSGVLLGLAAWGWLRPAAPASRVIRYTMVVPMEVNTTGYGPNFAVSPNDSLFAYVGPAPEVPGGHQLWLQERASLEAVPVPGTVRAHHPFFAPDGERIGVLTDDQRLLIISLRGEAPVELVRRVGSRCCAVWSPEGHIYFTADDASTDGRWRIGRVRATGGEIELVTRVDTAAGELAHDMVSGLLADGRGLLFRVRRGELFDPTGTDIAVLDVARGTHRRLSQGVYAVDAGHGYLLIVRADGTLHAAPFDRRRRELSGPTSVLLSGIGIERWNSADLVLSRGGTLFYGTDRTGFDGEEELVWVSRQGAVQPVDSGWTGEFGWLALSPDGRRAAVTLLRGEDHDQQIWIKELDRGPLRRLTREGARSITPTWMPDGAAVVYWSRSGVRPARGLHVRRADGVGKATFLAPDGWVGAATFSPDGAWLVYSRASENAERNLQALRIGTDSIATALMSSPFGEYDPAISPDGRWLAYASDETGRGEVFVRPFPDVERAKHQVSVNGGTVPRWAVDGRRLYYRGDGVMMEVEVLPGPTFRTGASRELFRTTGLSSRYDVAADGRFLMIRRLAEPSETEAVVVVQNFIREMLDRVRS